MNGNSTEIGQLDIGSDANGGITLNGAIVTDGAVTIDGPVTLATAAVSVTTADDNISFNHSIDGSQTLTLSSGAGAIVIDGAIGADHTKILTGLSINATDGDTGTIEVTDIGDDNEVGVDTGSISIGNNATISLTLDGTVYKTDGTTIYEAKSGDTILLTGDSPTIQTKADDLTFDLGNLVLSTDGTTTINTNIGSATAAGNLQIDGKINTSSSTEALVLNAGTGSVTVDGAIGDSGAFTTITIGGGSANGTIEVANIGGTNSGASGAVAVGNTSTGTLTLDGTVYKTGNTQTYTAATGGGNIDITGIATFTSTNTAIAFNTSGVDLGANVAITTGTTTNVGNVSFDGAIEAANAGTQTLTIDSGAGDVTFSKKIGETNALGGLNVNATSGDGDGDITFTEDIGDTSAGVKGVTAVGNSATNQIIFSEDTYTFDTGATTFTAASGDTIKLNKQAATTFTTDGTSITFATGTVDLDDGSDLTVNSGGGAISIASIGGASDELVVLNANDGTAQGSTDPADSSTETVTLGDVGNTGQTEIHNLTVTGDDGITLTGAIYTSDDDTLLVISPSTIL